MKKTIRSGIIAAVAVAAGYVAYQSHGSYNLQDNSLLMQNVEALASDPENWGEENPNGPITNKYWVLTGESKILVGGTICLKNKCVEKNGRKAQCDLNETFWDCNY